MLLEINLVAVREELLSTIEEGLLLGALVVKEARLGLNCPGWHVFSNKTSKVQIALLSNYHKERERERERERAWIEPVSASKASISKHFS